MTRTYISHTIRNIAGFTLIELLISIALIGIVAGIGGIQLYGVYERNKVNNVTTEITSTLDRARTLALSNSQPYQPPSKTPQCGGNNNPQNPVAQTNPYVTDVGTFVHNDSGADHDHIHLRYIFNCSPVNTTSNISPMAIDAHGGWYYQDSTTLPLNNWWVLDKTEDDFPPSIALSDNSFENTGVFFSVVTGKIDYTPAGSISAPAAGKSSTRFVQVHSTSQTGLYFDVCVYPDGHYETNPSGQGVNTCP